MGDVHYMISEASKQVEVEPHALRYWEDELELTIGRTEMGHRYYTKDDIQLFRCIKELKEQGMLLKDLKELIPDMLEAKQELKKRREKELLQEKDMPEELSTDEPVPENELETLLRKALSENNQVLAETLLKGMDMLLQIQEQQEEERYRKLDFVIRQQQTLRKNSGISPLGRFRKLVQV